MIKQLAIEAARKEADIHNVKMIVVNAPIENHEESSPYGYCPLAAKRILYPFGTVEEIIEPKSGERAGKIVA